MGLDGLETKGDLERFIVEALLRSPLAARLLPQPPATGGGGAPSGPAGGVLGGTYPNPGFAADMATQAELDAHTVLTTSAHGGIVASTDPRLTDVRTPSDGSVTPTKLTGSPTLTSGHGVVWNGSAWIDANLVLDTDTRLTNARTPTAHKASHEPGGSDALTLLTDASVAAANKDGVAGTASLRTLGAGAQQAVSGTDSRLSDSRNPTGTAGGSLAGTYPNPTLVAAAAAVRGGVTLSAAPAIATSPIAVGDNDSRMTNARTPTSHATTHQPGGGDAMAVDAAAATGSLRTVGTGALQAAAGNDSRLSDARTPTAHATSHHSGGSDALALASIAGSLVKAQTPLTTKGDLLVTDGTTLHRLPVGADGGALIGFSGAADGVAWGPVPFAWTAVVKQVADVTSAVTTFVNTDLVFTFVASGVYIIDLYLLATSVAATTGYRFALDTSVAVTTVGMHFEHVLANATGTSTAGDSIADATAGGLSSGVNAAGALVPIMATGILVAGATGGTCRLVFGPEVAASATFKANSVMRVHKAA